MELDNGTYRVAASLSLSNTEERKVRIPPFEAIEIDLGYILGHQD